MYYMWFAGRLEFGALPGCGEYEAAHASDTGAASPAAPGGSPTAMSDSLGGNTSSAEPQAEVRGCCKDGNDREMRVCGVGCGACKSQWLTRAAAVAPRESGLTCSTRFVYERVKVVCIQHFLLMLYSMEAREIPSAARAPPVGDIRVYWKLCT